MTAILKPIGMLKTYIEGKDEVPIEAGQTIRQALQGLGIRPELVALALVNEEAQSKDTLIQEGDVVKIIAVIGGG